MNAIMASLGGRAPPGQNTLTPCEESRSLVEAPGSPAPGPSTSPPCPSERQPACRCRPPPSSPIAALVLLLQRATANLFASPVIRCPRLLQSFAEKSFPIN